MNTDQKYTQKHQKSYFLGHKFYQICDIIVLDLLCLVKSFLLGNFTLKTSQRDKESSKSFNSTDPLSPNSESLPALSNSGLSIQLKSLLRNKGIPGNACLHRLKKFRPAPWVVWSIDTHDLKLPVMYGQF